MEKLYVFEAFAGIGSQHRALHNLKSNKKLDFEISYISEWYVNAIFGYVATHKLNNKISYKEFYNENLDVIKDFINNNTFSLDSKKPSNNIMRKGEDFIRKLYASCKVSNNLLDISKIRGSNLNKKINLMTYSFPCQDLSVAGKGLGIKKNSNTRSSLLWEIYRILTELKFLNRLPNTLLMENVTNIVSTKHRKDLDEFKLNLLDLGYYSHELIINSKDHNIPQNRKRFFMISTLKKQNENDFIIKKRELKNNLSDYIDINLLEDTPRQEIYLKYIKEIIKDKNITNPLELKFSNLNVYPTFNQANYVHGIYSKIIPTITFSGENSRQRILFENKNKLFVKHLSSSINLQLMGFKIEDFKNMINFGISKEKIRGLAGNSIVVNVLEDIFLSIVDFYNKF